MAFISWLTLKLCTISSVLWFQNYNAHTLIKHCYIWCYCDWSWSLWSLSIHIYTLQITLSTAYGRKSYICNYLMTLYSPYHSQVKIILALTEREMSPLTFSWKLLSSVLQLSCSAMSELPWWNYTPLVYPHDHAFSDTMWSDLPRLNGLFMKFIAINITQRLASVQSSHVRL